MSDELSSAFIGAPSIIDPDEVRQTLIDPGPLEDQGLARLAQQIQAQDTPVSLGQHLDASIAEKLGVTPEEVHERFQQCHCEWPEEFKAKVRVALARECQTSDPPLLELMVAISKTSVEGASELRRVYYEGMREVFERSLTLRARFKRIWNRLVH